MSERRGGPELVVLALIAALVAGALLLGGDGGSRSRERGAAPVSARRIALVERRVEALRGLRFRRPVPVVVVSAAQARREGLRDFDRSAPPARRAAEEEVAKLLGLLPSGVDLRRIVGQVFAGQVAGYYDPRRDRLALVRGAGVDDVTLAHELTHALEDQRFDLERLGDGPGADAASAEQALAEGTATLVAERYARRFPGAVSFGDALGALAHATSGAPLPPYVMRALLFPYLAGERFVRALVREGGGWRLANRALRARPPCSTAQVLDPDRWLRDERPARVRLPAAGAVLGRGWRRVAGSTSGREDLSELLFDGAGPLAARTLAATWRGGRYELWRRGRVGEPGCASPCRRRDALVLVWRVASPATARGVAAALVLWRRGLPHGAHAAIAARGALVRVALAPSAERAARLVR